MTIMEALHRIDSIKPNSYSQTEKVQWLSTLDGIIKAEIIDTHEDLEGIEFEGYSENTALNHKLLVPAPYDEVYLFWLESKIDYWSGEVGKYNNSVSMFNNAYDAFAKYYNRTHKPLGRKYKFFGPITTPEYQVSTEFAKVFVEED